jgi:hypothetical protein
VLSAQTLSTVDFRLLVRHVKPVPGKFARHRVICALRKVKNFDRIGHGAAGVKSSREDGAGSIEKAAKSVASDASDWDSQILQ